MKEITVGIEEWSFAKAFNQKDPLHSLDIQPGYHEAIWEWITETEEWDCYLITGSDQ